jgi:hypothetical protein
MLLQVVCLGLGLVLAEPDAEPKMDAATRTKIRKLQKEHVAALKKAMAAIDQQFLAGRSTVEGYEKISKPLLRAELAVAATPAERLAAHAGHLERMKKLAELAKARHEAGQMGAADYHLAVAAHLEARIGWLKAGGKEKKAKDGK